MPDLVTATNPGNDLSNGLRESSYRPAREAGVRCYPQLCIIPFLGADPQVSPTRTRPKQATSRASGPAPSGIVRSLRGP